MSPRITSGSSKGLTVRLMICSDPFVLTRRPFNGYLRLLGHRFTDGDSQLCPQALAGHGIDVQVRFSDRRFQVLPGLPGKVEDISLVVDEHHRRCDGLEDERLGNLDDAGT